MRKPLYTRLPPTKHRLLAEYALKCGKSVSDVIEMIVDQLLYQVIPSYRAPPWLLAAIEKGQLEIEPRGAEQDVTTATG